MELTKEELLGRWEDIREIRNVMGRISADYVLREERRMFDAYWSKRDDVCLGINTGYYVGPEAVKGYYAYQDRIIAKESKKIQELFPEELGDKSAEEVYGVGMMDYKPTDTYVVEEAVDGQTAKGMWMIRGAHSKLTTGGPAAYWEWGWFAVDFILEDGAWKVWHMLYLQDINRIAGQKWTGEEKGFKEREEFAGWTEEELPTPTVSMTVHETYHAKRAFSGSPKLPEPYDTFANTFSYGYTEDGKGGAF